MKYFQTKIEESLEFKKKGNEMFKIKNYQKAIENYTEGMKKIDPNTFYGATKE